METTTILTSVSALILVLGLVWLVSLLLRKYGNIGMPVATRGEKKRLKIVDALVVGPKHKLVLVQRDNTEHLLLIGPERDIIVESDIKDSGL